MITTDQNVAGYLQNAFLHNRAAHAYIVVGEKQQLPDLLKQCASVCMCRNHLVDDCDVCKKVRLETHQDVLHFPADPPKSRLTVADMLVLVDECYKRPVDNGDCRVFLIDATNSTVGVAAEVWQNKLLKTLEEPTDNVYIFIGVTDAEGLLPTIRSRCQILRQTKLSAAQVCDILHQKGFERKVCEVAASVCGGSVQTAENVLANPALLRAFDNAASLAENMTSTKNALPFVSAILAEKDTVTWCLHFLSVLYRESVVYRLADGLCLLPSHKQTIENICKNYTLQAAEVCTELVNSAKKRLDDGGNVTVVMDKLASSILEVRYRCRI